MPTAALALTPRPLTPPALGQDENVPEVDTPERRRAVDEIRAAEAARVLGMLDVTPLPTKAAEWIAAGIRYTSAVALAALARPGTGLANTARTRAADDIGPDDIDPDGTLRAQLLGNLAIECGIGFRTTAEARAVHANTVIAALRSANGTGTGTATPMIVDFSNNYTDELTERVKAALRRWFHRPGKR